MNPAWLVLIVIGAPVLAFLLYIGALSVYSALVMRANAAAADEDANGFGWPLRDERDE